MKESRFVVAQFCDDIRREIGNKFSLMGCFGSEVIVNKLPAGLEKLCAHVRVFSTREDPIRSLVVRAYLNNELIATVDVPKVHLGDSFRQHAPETGKLLASHNVMLMLSSIYVVDKSLVRIEAETERETLTGPSVEIRARTSEEAYVQ